MIAQTLTQKAAPSAWRASGAALLALLFALVIAYWDTGAAMVGIWIRSETFAHAFVVPPIVLWLVWRQRAVLARITPRPMPWALLPIAAMALVWLVGDLTAANSAKQLAFTAMLVLSVPLILGREVARALLFPLVFTFFAVPIGEFMTPWMMQWTADFTIMAVRASGVPVYREGLQFVIPSGTWSVVEACSGVRYLMASFMVGSLFAYLNYSSNRKRWIFVGISILMPILANWLRAYMIVMLGHLSNNTIATGADHLVYGWVFFGIVVFVMFIAGARWADPEPEPVLATPTAHGDVPVAGQTAALLVALITGLVIALLPPKLLMRLAEPAHLEAPALVLPQSLAGGWVAVQPFTDWQPVFADPSVTVRQAYQSAAGRVAVHIAYYRNQNDTRKLITSTNVLALSEDRQWNIIRQGTRNVPTASGVLPMRSGELLGAAQPGSSAERPHLQVLRVYWVGGRLTSNEVAAKLYTAWQRVAGHGDESAAVLVYTDDSSAAAAADRLDAFVRDNMGLLQARLQSVSQAPLPR